jgi:hypothetical protein
LTWLLNVAEPVAVAGRSLIAAVPRWRGSQILFAGRIGRRSKVFPDTRAVVRTRPLEALIIGGYVRGLSDRDIESLAEEAELGHVSKSTVSRIYRKLRDHYTAFCTKSLSDITVIALFLDAVYLPTRPSGQKEGVLVVWGYTTEGKRVLLSVRLGQRESHEGWLDLGRFPGETSCLSMCWAVLDLFLAGARRLGLSDLEYKQVGPMKIAPSHREQTSSKVATCR